MIKKIILKRATQSIINKSKLRKFIGRGGKIQKIKAQSSPIKSGKWTDVDADMRARTKFDSIFDSSEDNIYQGVKILSVRKAAAESLASKTAVKKWNRSLPKHIKRERSTIASRVRSFRKENLASGQVNPSAFKTREASANYPLIKRSIKKSKNQSFIKVLDRKDLQFEKIRSKTSELFTGRSGKNPLTHKLTDTKFITTKKFKKGKMDEWSQSMMPAKGFQGESFAKLKGAAYHEKRRMIKFANMPGNKTSDGQVKWSKFWNEEKKRKREWAQSFPKKKK